MRIQWTTLFGIRQNIKIGVWEVKFNVRTTKDEVIRHLNRLFKGELERELRIGLGNNPYRFKSIPPIEVQKEKSNQSFQISKDYDGFIAALMSALDGETGGDKLCFNIKNRGFDCEYFCFRTAGDKSHIEMKSIIDGTYIFKDYPNQNVRRLLCMLFEREYPIIKMWLPRPGIENDDDILVDYPDEERKYMLQFRYNKYPGREDYE